jgi:hypothetical protein
MLPSLSRVILFPIALSEGTGITASFCTSHAAALFVSAHDPMDASHRHFAAKMADSFRHSPLKRIYCHCP